MLSERADAEEGSDSEAEDDGRAVEASKSKKGQAASKASGKASGKGKGKSTRASGEGAAGAKSRVASASEALSTADGGDVKKGAHLLKRSKKGASASAAPKDKKRKLQAIFAPDLTFSL